MNKPIIIKGRVPALVGEYTRFDPANPTNTPAHGFTFIDAMYVVDGKVDSSWSSYRLVGWAEITVELLPVADMMASAVDSLKAQKQKIIADAQLEATRLEGEIQKLLAISYEPQVVDA